MKEISVQLISQLPETVLDDALKWEKIFLPIVDIKRKRLKHLEVIADRHRTPFLTVRNKFYDYLKHGFAGLIDRRAAGSKFWESEEKIGVSQADQDLLKTYCENYQRNNDAAIRAMRRDWKEGKIKTDAEFDVLTGYPRGWSERNLARYAPSEVELAAARQGLAAADEHRQLVYTTRKDLYVGQFYLFDDIWHDHFVNLLDTQQTGRPLEFHALDLASAYKMGWGMRVRREVDGVNESLKTADFRFLLATILLRDGYNPEGTTLVPEHGTTVIDERTEKLLALATVTSACPKGAIRVSRSGMQGAAAHAGQYAGRAKGNFRFKAALESLGNLIHNEMAFLPGQTGKDRDHRPAQLHGLLKHNDALLCALAQLPPERAKWLQWDLCTFHQFQLIAQEIYARINARVKHKLEGWDERYVPCQQSGRLRRMAPVEFWKQGRRALQPIDLQTAALIIGTDGGIERPVKKGMIQFHDSEISGDLLRFDAHALPARSKFLAVLNPFDPSYLTCFDAKGRYAATLSRVQSDCRGDVEALRRSCGRAEKILNAQLLPMRKRHMRKAREKRARHKNNTRVTDLTRPFTEEEKAADRTRRSRTVDIDQFIENAEPVRLENGDGTHIASIDDFL